MPATGAATTSACAASSADPPVADPSTGVRLSLATREACAALAHRCLVDRDEQQAYWLGQRPQDLVQLRAADACWLGVLAHDPATDAAVGLAELCDGALSFLVHPAWRRRGVAGLLARLALEQHARVHPGRPLSARALRSNEASRRLLESLGFRVKATRQFELGTRQRHAVLYFGRAASAGGVPTCEAFDALGPVPCAGPRS